MTETARANAPAKINLALHVTGQRDDGYHTIETVAVFADIGDRIDAAPAATDSFSIEGPEAGALAGEDRNSNLVLRARDLLRATAAEAGRRTSPVALTLDKHLPAGGGIGGGSADAAATLRALMRLWTLEDLSAAIRRKAASLGADVPMCLACAPLLATGIGERITPIHAMPALPVVLVNPRVHVSTPSVFTALAEKANPPLPRAAMASLRTIGDWTTWLGASTRNDLEPPARSLAPAIGHCLAALDATGAALVRMSGSGATSFAVYSSEAEARDVASRLLRRHPDWWIKAGMTYPSGSEAP